MKRTLMICPEYPLPASSGTNIRTMNFVNFFMERGSVDVACPSIPPAANVAPAIFTTTYAFEQSRASGFKWRFFKGLYNGTPIPVRALQQKDKQNLDRIIFNGRYDYVFMRYLYYAHVLFNNSRRLMSKIILDVDDILSRSLYRSRFGIGKGILKKALLDLNRNAVIRYERRCLDLGALLFCSEPDRRAFTRENPRSNTFVVPNIYSNPDFTGHDFGNGMHKGNTLLFVGMLNYKPNIEGLVWFIHSIFPQFKQAHRGVKLMVVGRNPLSQIQEICRREEGISLHSNVTDIRKYYEACKAVIVPLLSGSGTRIKILEAIQAGRPVMTTSKGVEGMDLCDGIDILQFDHAEEFIRKYRKLENAEYYRTLTGSAFEKLRTRYTEKQFFKAMEQVLQEMGEPSERLPG